VEASISALRTFIKNCENRASSIYRAWSGTVALKNI
jgi:hypothetical protein